MAKLFRVKSPDGSFEIRGNFSFKDIEKTAPASAKKFLTKLALAVEGQAVLLCPVDTARLRNSITYSIEGDTQAPGAGAKSEDGVKPSTTRQVAVVGTNVKYAPVQEFGSARQGYAQPFLRPAFDLVTGRKTAKTVKDELNKEYAKRGIKSK